MKAYFTAALLCAVVTAIPAANRQCSVVSSVSHTFYGIPDNDPAGSAATAYDCGGRNYIAGGVGTFSNPLTFAAAPGVFSQCEVIYDPYVRKYIRYEDYCQACVDDWAKGIVRIDIFTGSNIAQESGYQDQINCENALTPELRSQKFVRNPASNLVVDGIALLLPGASETILMLTKN